MITYPPFLMTYLSFSSFFRSFLFSFCLSFFSPVFCFLPVSFFLLFLFSFCLAFSPPVFGILPVSYSLLVVVSVGFDVQDEVMHRVFLHDFHTSPLALLLLICIVLLLLLHWKWHSLYCQFPFLFQLVP